MQRTATLPLATIDPADISTHQQRVHLPCSPFSSGEWGILFTPGASKLGQYSQSTVLLSWTSCVEKLARPSTLRVVGVEMKKTLVFPDYFPPTSALKLNVGRPEKLIELSLEAEVGGEESSVASRLMPLIDNRDLLDICLNFPGNSRTLWASSAVLSQVSPWWKTTLSQTGFSESFSSLTTLVYPFVEDSDAEEDDPEDEKACEPLSTLATPPPSPPSSFRSRTFTTQAFRPPHRTIPITGTSYTTYRAFLLYLLTGQLSFAPLTSSFLPSPAALSSGSSTSSHSRLSLARSRRHSRLYASSLLTPSLPLAVSPKSMFRLAHFLEIPDLSKLSLDALKTALSVENVVWELFGFPLSDENEDEEEADGMSRREPLGETYDEVLKVEVDYAKEHWEDVKQSRAMKEVKERLEREGSTAYEARTLLGLLSVEE
ncbi:hypothetical protein JCM8547_008046 [Rhodosporidiobolus lusitaniae]